MLQRENRAIHRPWRPLTLLLGLILALAPITAGADGLTPWDVAKLRQVEDIAVAPEGGAVAYTLSVPRDPFAPDDGSAWRELHVLDADGASRPYITGEVRVGDLGWTPDGSAISFLAKRGDDETSGLYTIALSGGEARRVLGHDTDIDAYAWHPEGHTVAFLAEPDASEERQEQEEMGFDQEVVEEDLRPVEVWIARLDGESRRLGLPGSASEISWSPDGSRLSVALAPTPLVDDDIMLRRVKVVDPETGAITAEVANPGKLGPVAWSPDGRRLALISGVDLHDPRAGRLMVVSADGGTPEDLLPDWQGHVIDFVWTDDGDLLFVGHQGVEAALHRVTADGSGHKVVLEAGGPIWEDLERGGATLALVADTPEHPSEVYRLEGAAAVRRTDSNPWLADVELARQEVVRWQARDGLELEGLLIHPLGAEEGSDAPRHPLITVVHGGPESHYSNGWLTRYSTPGQMGAARGFAVFYPNYRGSTGRGVEFSKSSQGDPAGAEFDDVVDGVDHLIERGLVDEAKVGVTGGSYGGYATAWMSTYYSERFAAGVMFVGISEKISKWGTSDIPNELNWVHDRHWPWEKWDLMVERSPVHYVEKARTPLLIMHGKEDTRVHPSQSLILFRYLKTLGKTPVRLVWYPDEGHGNRRAAHQLDYSLRMLRWFEHYLQGEGGDKPPATVEYEAPEAEPNGSETGG